MVPTLFRSVFSKFLNEAGQMRTHTPIHSRPLSPAPCILTLSMKKLTIRRINRFFNIVLGALAMLRLR